ncbi:hypothetical protein AB3S75_000008 [Citrus x aurantiifolia]
MFRFASSLASKVSRLPSSSIRLVPARLYCSKNYRYQNLKFVSPHTKYADLMIRSMFFGGQKLVEEGVHPNALEKGFILAGKEVNRYLKGRARLVRTFEEIAEVATAAAKQNEKVGEIVAKAIMKVGTQGLVFTTDDEEWKDELELLNVMNLDWAPPSHYFTEKITETCVFNDPLILIHDATVSNLNVIEQAIGQAHARPLLIVAGGIEDRVLGSLLLDTTRLQKGVTFCVINPTIDEDFKASIDPGFLGRRNAILQDLAILTGSQVLNGASELNYTPSILGSCKQVRVSRRETLFIGGSGCQEAIKERCEQLRSAIELSTLDDEVWYLKWRLAQLSRAASIVKVGGSSKVSKLSASVFDNALNIARLSVRKGILPGSGVAFLHASKELDKLQTANYDENAGIKLLQNALKVPVSTIASAAGLHGSSVANMLLEEDNPDLGYDPTKGKYVDVIKSRIFDPLMALQEELNKVLWLINKEYHIYNSRRLEK